MTPTNQLHLVGRLGPTGLGLLRRCVLVLLLGGPMTATEIGAELDVSSSTITLALQVLEREEYITRTRVEGDGRSSLAHVTDKTMEAVK